MKEHTNTTFSIFQRNPSTSEIYEVKKVTFVVFHNEEPEVAAEENLMEIYGWSKGLHYDHVKIINQQIVKSNNTDKKMAKKAETKAVAVVAEEVVQKGIVLPEIPENLSIGGIEFSKETIQKEVDEAKKLVIGKITKDDTVESLQEKKKIYEELKDKKNRFVKTRTAPENFRKEVVKPINEFAKKLKSVTDGYGEVAKAGEEHCLAQMKVYEDWEAEQQRLEQEAIDKRVKERSQQLTDIKGQINFESGHWTFPYASHIIIEKDQLENEFGWNEVFNEANEAYQSHIKAEEAEKAKNQGMAEALYNARVMLLDMMGGYEKTETGYSKNGHTLTNDEITNTPDAEWKSLIQSHNTPKQQVSSFGGGFSSGTFGGGNFGSTTQEPQATQSQPVSHPFAQFENSNQAPVQETIQEPKVSDKPFTVWDEPFVLKVMANTTILVGPQDSRDLMIDHAKGRTIVYNENLDNSNLCYIIFKNA